MRYLKTNKIYCFSPGVMLATFVIEIILVVWAMRHYRSQTTTKLAVAILLLLAVFQLAEFNVCTAALGLDSLSWSRIGYVAITFLPPLGIHLIATIAKKSPRALIIGSYVTAAVFAGFFLLASHGVSAAVCSGNYVIFKTAPGVSTLYGMYYYGLELIALLYALYYAKRIKNKRQRQALYGLSLGYLCLLVPTTTVNLINPETLKAIPSIMCGFAVLLALILALYVLPRVARKRG